MQNDREARQTLGDFVQNVEAQRRRNEDALFIASALFGLELVSAVGGADRDCEGVNASLGNELLDLFRTGVRGILVGNLDFVLNAGERAQFAFDYNAVIVRVLDDLLGQRDVVRKGLGGTVDHNGGEAAVDAALAQFERIAVVEVHADREIKARGLFRVFNRRFDQLHQIDVLRIRARTLGNLQDQRSALFDRRFGDALDDLHIVYVESADGVTAIVGFLKHLGRGYESHIVQHSFIYGLVLVYHFPATKSSRCFKAHWI